MCVGVGGGGAGAVSRQQRRELQSVEHLDAALITDGSVDSGSAVTTCVDVGAFDGGVSRKQWRELQSVEHMDAALVTDGSVDSGSAATTYVGVGEGGGDISRRQVDRLSPRVWMLVEAAVVSVDGSGESCSRWSTWTQLSSPTAVSTVDRLPT